MKHYDPDMVLAEINLCVFFQSVSTETAQWVRALVKQANSAYRAQVRYERELALRLRTAVDERQTEIAGALEAER